jgi:hypothetical protein
MACEESKLRIIQRAVYAEVYARIILEIGIINKRSYIRICLILRIGSINDVYPQILLVCRTRNYH